VGCLQRESRRLERLAQDLCWRPCWRRGGPQTGGILHLSSVRASVGLQAALVAPTCAAPTGEDTGSWSRQRGQGDHPRPLPHNGPLNGCTLPQEPMHAPGELVRPRIRDRTGQPPGDPLQAVPRTSLQAPALSAPAHVGPALRV
jgi:hypothetical protein